MFQLSSAKRRPFVSDSTSRIPYCFGHTTACIIRIIGACKSWYCCWKGRILFPYPVWREKHPMITNAINRNTLWLQIPSTETPSDYIYHQQKYPMITNTINRNTIWLQIPSTETPPDYKYHQQKHTLITNTINRNTLWLQIPSTETPSDYKYHQQKHPLITNTINRDTLWLQIPSTETPSDYKYHQQNTLWLQIPSTETSSDYKYHQQRHPLITSTINRNTLWLQIPSTETPSDIKYHQQKHPLITNTSNAKVKQKLYQIIRYRINTRTILCSRKKQRNNSLDGYSNPQNLPTCKYDMWYQVCVYVKNPCSVCLIGFVMHSTFEFMSHYNL